MRVDENELKRMNVETVHILLGKIQDLKLLGSRLQKDHVIKLKKLNETYTENSAKILKDVSNLVSAGKKIASHKEFYKIKAEWRKSKGLRGSQIVSEEASNTVIKEEVKESDDINQTE